MPGTTPRTPASVQLGATTKRLDRRRLLGSSTGNPRLGSIQLVFIALSIGLAAVLCTALIHYVTMTAIVESGSLSRMSRMPRFVMMILAISVTHLVEAAVWALALGLGLRTGLGALEGVEVLAASDVLGFSLVNFATLGLGVLSPTDDLKFVAAMGALNGFLLITCSASFLHRAISKD